MMKVAFFILISQICLISCDLFDDARDQLESLDATIKASILETQEMFVSTIDLVIDSEKAVYSNHLENLINLNNAVNSSLALLQEAAENSTVDVSDCLKEAEILPTLYKLAASSIQHCSDDGIESCINLLTDSVYLVNIPYNQIQAIRFQLVSCNPDDQDCAQSVLDRIERSGIELKQSIGTNVENFQETVVIIQKTSKICANSTVDTFILGSNTTLTDISSCIEKAEE